MHFNAPALLAVAGLVASATAAPSDSQLAALLRRQEPGTPAHDCHSNCGSAISLSKKPSPCENSDFLDLYAKCLACAGPDDVNIWRYYGITLGAAGETCGLSTTPGAAPEEPAPEPTEAPVEAEPTTTEAPVVEETTTEAPVEAEPTEAPVEETTTEAPAVEETEAPVVEETPVVSTPVTSAPAVEETVVPAPVEEETVYVTICESSTAVVPPVPVGTGSVVPVPSNGTVVSPPAPTFTGAAAANKVMSGAVAVVLAVAAAAL